MRQLDIYETEEVSGGILWGIMGHNRINYSRY